nr:hypothetical protein GW17_00050212 [Ipomoea batatas]
MGKGFESAQSGGYGEISAENLGIGAGLLSWIICFSVAEIEAFLDNFFYPPSSTYEEGNHSKNQWDQADTNEHNHCTMSHSPAANVKLHVSALQHRLAAPERLSPDTIPPVVPLPAFEMRRRKRSQEPILKPYPRQEAYQGLHMVPSDRVSDKSQRLVPNDVQELERVKHGHVAPVGLPPPLHEPIVRPPVFHAVLVLVDRPTRVIGVIRAVRVGHPFPGENVAPLAVRLDLDLLLLPPVERRRHLLRRVEGGEIWVFIIERPENRDQRYCD